MSSKWYDLSDLDLEDKESQIQWFIKRIGPAPTCQLCGKMHLPYDLVTSIWEDRYPGKYCKPCRDFIFEERRNAPYPCGRCSQPYPLTELKDVNDIPGQHYRYCPSCIDIVRNAYTTKCRSCSNIFKIPKNADCSIFCDQCKTTVNKREYVRVRDHRSRAINLGLSATLSYRQWIGTLVYFGWRCAYCSSDFECIEHFIPESMGGATSVNNCIPACLSCNVKKGSTHPVDIDRFFSSQNLTRIREYIRTQP